MGIFSHNTIHSTRVGIHFTKVSSRSNSCSTINDPYHSLIFVLLDSIDDDWDSLMFQEYLGVNPVIVGFQMVAMFICYLLFSKYLTGSYTS